jgi:NAD(P)-dependent dehydrogenase (short-subunit alcohol dehydrogenase family)
MRVLPPDLIEATPLGGYEVNLRFADGLAADVDLSYLVGLGPVFEPLRDIDYFRKLKVTEFRDTIEWPNEADIAPETLYDHVQRAVYERRGQMVVISSVYAFANGMGNTPYAVAKAGVESLGRALRVELAPHGASATVAYFGWVDTKLVQDAFDQPDGGRIRDLSPDFLLKRITPAEAGAGLVRGIEERAPRVFVPKWWRYVSALRGIVNPLLDRRMESDAKTQALIRDLDAKAVDAGKPSASS